ncbi:hypothetical protein B0H12DRAFT_1074504 [Mycena haematopus]|nr:hypothetical protein B0H12DRAFT_1074504 [Mycena haematopus]
MDWMDWMVGARRNSKKNEALDRKQARGWMLGQQRASKRDKALDAWWASIASVHQVKVLSLGKARKTGSAQTRALERYWASNTDKKRKAKALLEVAGRIGTCVEKSRIQDPALGPRPLRASRFKGAEQQDKALDPRSVKGKPASGINGCVVCMIGGAVQNQANDTSRNWKLEPVPGDLWCRFDSEA